MTLGTRRSRSHGAAGISLAASSLLFAESVTPRTSGRTCTFRCRWSKDGYPCASPMTPVHTWDTSDQTPQRHALLRNIRDSFVESVSSFMPVNNETPIAGQYRVRISLNFKSNTRGSITVSMNKRTKLIPSLHAAVPLNNTRCTVQRWNRRLLSLFFFFYPDIE